MRLGLREGLVAAAASLATAVVLPLQTYLGNPGAFPFSAARLLSELAGLAALLFAALLLLAFGLDALARLARLRHRPSALFFSVLTGLLVCLYLETGLLSAGIPELNGGAVPELANRGRGAFDLAVWTALVLGFALLTRRLRPYLGWIALAALALSAASLADASVGRATAAPPAGTAAREEGAAQFVNQPTVVANVRYSSTTNILVFVLDSMPGRRTAEVVRTNAALCAKFPGFTAYPRNVGMHECTKRGVPGLVTGRHYDPREMPEGEYPMTMYGTNSFVSAAEDAGWAVAFAPDLLPYGRTNLPIAHRVAAQAPRRSRDAFALLRQTTEVPHLSLLDLAVFRLVPFVAKGPVLYGRIRHAVKGRHGRDEFWDERQMYPLLAARPADGARPFLGFFHSVGVHPPWTRDLDGEIADKLGRLGDLFAAYRASGLYDRSTIVVAADHGLFGLPADAAYPSSASAMLWVKPANAKGAMSFGAAATSHAGVAPLVKAALGRNLSAEECRARLETARRLYRSKERDGTRERFRDWDGTAKGVAL